MFSIEVDAFVIWRSLSDTETSVTTPGERLNNVTSWALIYRFNDLMHVAVLFTARLQCYLVLVSPQARDLVSLKSSPNMKLTCPKSSRLTSSTTTLGFPCMFLIAAWLQIAFFNWVALADCCPRSNLNCLSALKFKRFVWTQIYCKLARVASSCAGVSIFPPRLRSQMRMRKGNWETPSKRRCKGTADIVYTGWDS